MPYADALFQEGLSPRGLPYLVGCMPLSLNVNFLQAQSVLVEDAINTLVTALTYYSAIPVAHL